MKKQYTEMVTSLRKAHKATGMSYEGLMERFYKMAEDDPPEERTLRKLSVEMEYSYEVRKDARHIFMPGRRFCEWLADCAKTLDPALGAKAVEGFGTNFVCLHFPCESGLPSALLGIGRGKVKWGVVLAYSMGHPLGGCAVFTKLDGRDTHEEMPFRSLNCDADTPRETRQRQADTGEFYTRMIAGIGLYMGAFPEQVKPGIPPDAKRADYAAGNAKTIGVAEEVVTRDGVTPHYRVGHFRLLTADRYVNKKGQVVFVTGCFVHGQAKTVLSPEGAE